MVARSALAATLAWIITCLITAPAGAATPSWTTYHRDAQRSGIDPDSTSPVAPAQLWQTSPALDGDVYGEPLVYGARVYVATENDTVYALDVATGAVVWQRHLATAVPAGKLPCGNISPVVGITSTPVIDPATGAIYVVADTWDGSTTQSVRHRMFGLSLVDGSPTAGLPMTVDPPGSTTTAQLQRAGLALDGGKVVIGYGGNAGDCGSYHGWLIAAPEAGGPLQSFEVNASTSQGAIWGSGNSPAVDSGGDIWAATGNGSSSSFGYQESVLKLSANLSLLDHWAPSNWAMLDSTDTDLGSTMPLLLPGGLVFEIGKQGVGYLLSAASLGGTGTPPVYQATVCSGSWGGGIYLNGVIYVACSDGMHALSLDETARTFAPLSGWTVNRNAIGPPIFAGGMVWATGWANGILYGLDPGTGATSFSANLGGFDHFATPSAAGGELFVANHDQVTAYRIANPPPQTATAMVLTSSANPSRVGQNVAFKASVSPSVDSGTIAFAANGKPLGVCHGTIGAPGNAAICSWRLTAPGKYTITAAYSGDQYFAPSSASLVQTVIAPAPVLSRLHAAAVRRRLALAVTSSLPAKLTVTVYRRARRRLVHVVTLGLGAHGGRNSFRPRMRALTPGSYEVTIVGLTRAGGRSRLYRTAFAVPRR